MATSGLPPPISRLGAPQRCDSGCSREKAGGWARRPPPFSRAPGWWRARSGPERSLQGTSRRPGLLGSRTFRDAVCAFPGLHRACPSPRLARDPLRPGSRRGCARKRGGSPRAHQAHASPQGQRGHPADRRRRVPPQANGEGSGARTQGFTFGGRGSSSVWSRSGRGRGDLGAHGAGCRGGASGSGLGSAGRGQCVPERQPPSSAGRGDRARAGVAPDGGNVLAPRLELRVPGRLRPRGRAAGDSWGRAGGCAWAASFRGGLPPPPRGASRGAPRPPRERARVQPG